MKASDSKKDLLYEHAEEVISKKKSDLLNNRKCYHCFMSSSLCICEEIKEMYASEDKIKSKILLYTHFKEWGRATNTGKLLNIGLPKSTSLYMYGVKNDENELFNELDRIPSIIVYPSPTAESISSYRDWFLNNREINICVIDSTWPLSHSMEKLLPIHIPRVKIDELVSQPSQFLSRKQSENKSKVSTIEALTIGLKSLGESETALNPFNQSLQFSVDAILTQNGKSPVYGNKIKPNISTEDSSGPFSLPKIKKPKNCLICGINESSARFRNLGIRKNWINHPREESIKDEEEKVLEEIKNDNSEIDKVARLWFCNTCKNYFTLEIS